MGSSEAEEAFGDDGARASGGTTKETTDVKPARHPLSGMGRSARRRQERPLRRAEMATDRTASGAPRRTDGEDDPPIIVGERVKAKADTMWEASGEAHPYSSVAGVRHRGMR